MSLHVNNLRWHSIGWSPIKSMTQLNYSLVEGFYKAIRIIKVVGGCSNYRLVRLQKMTELGKDTLISCDGWPDQ